MSRNEMLTCLDLFCGCGGFSLGMQRAGFRVLAALDFNHEAIETYRRNFPKVPLVLSEDLTKFDPESLDKMLGRERVDVIVGGPPCQGFSTARQRDGANHGQRRFVVDPRRQLYREFLRYIAYFQPRVFVMENVLGIKSAAGGEHFARLQAEARAIGRAAGKPGYRVQSQTEDAWELGVPQKRRRQLIIGVRNDLPGYFPGNLEPASRARPHTNLGSAIGDLPIVRAGAGEEVCAYDMARRTNHLREFGSSARSYLFNVLQIARTERLTAHRARPHSARDLRDFGKLREGQNSKEAMDKGVQFEFPYDNSSFKDRYTRQSRWEPCSTIVAHLSKDGLMFIHPTECRSLTPREAARVQSFPDWFEFPVARTHQFRLIGNAVPPLVSEAVGIAVKSYIERARGNSKSIKFDPVLLPKDEKQAVHWLLPLLDLDKRALRGVPDDDFKRGWFSIAFLYAGLHPDSALEHGTRVAHDAKDHALVSRVEPRLVKPYYEQSGWPVVLAPVAKEAWRRYKSGSIIRIRSEDVV